MGMNYKTVWRKIGGRTIPIRESLMGAPSELQKVMHARRAREYLKEATVVGDKYGAMFVKKSLKDSKIVGERIAMRISRLAKIARRIK